MVFTALTSNLCRSTPISIVRYSPMRHTVALPSIPSYSYSSSPSRSFSGVDTTSATGGTNPNNTDDAITTTIHQQQQQQPPPPPLTFESRIERGPIPKANLPFHHFYKKSHRTPPNIPHTPHKKTIPQPPKFESPRKRANKMMRTIIHEAIAKSKSSNPDVHNTPFRVGDAIELTLIQEGGIHTTSPKTEKVRGVVLGRTNRGLGSNVYLRDVVMGESINRLVPMHSPLVKKVERLEENFVFKGRRKIKRAKLYYLNDRKLEETRVTKLR